MNFLNKLFGKRSGAKPAHKKQGRRLPERKLAPVDDIVEQGLLVANVAARMGVKNTIIMNALRRDIDYDVDQIEELVRENIAELAAERIKDANHIKRVRDEVRKYGRSAWQEAEYGTDDLRTLKHRQEVYEELANKLRSESEDDEFIAKIAGQARDQAWAEVGDSLKDRASHPYYGGGSTPEYKRERNERIQEFIDVELAALLKSKKSIRRKKPKQNKE